MLYTQRVPSMSERDYRDYRQKKRHIPSAILKLPSCTFYASAKSRAIMNIRYNRITGEPKGREEKTYKHTNRNGNQISLIRTLLCYQICLCSQYNIKKKEELVEAAPQEEPNPLMRKKKTPEELAAEAEQEDLDDFTSKYYTHSGAYPRPFIMPSSVFDSHLRRYPFLRVIKTPKMHVSLMPEHNVNKQSNCNWEREKNVTIRNHFITTSGVRY